MQTASGRVNQKTRTRTAIVRAAAELSSTGREVTMPEVAKAALVSEATAYRYFPDLASLLREAIADQIPSPEEALAGGADPLDPAQRNAARPLPPRGADPRRPRVPAPPRAGPPGRGARHDRRHDRPPRAGQRPSRHAL